MYYVHLGHFGGGARNLAKLRFFPAWPCFCSLLITKAKHTHKHNFRRSNRRHRF